MLLLSMLLSNFLPQIAHRIGWMPAPGNLVDFNVQYWPPAGVRVENNLVRLLHAKAFWKNILRMQIFGI